MVSKSKKKVYVDIETTGLSYEDPITIITTHNGRETKQFIHGKNLHEFKQYIKDYDVFCGFNIKSFDKPRIEHHLGKDIFKDKEIEDVMYIARNKGFTGGQKKIEQELGIERKLPDMDGRMAAILGLEYIKTQNQQALDILKEYNKEDVLNLKKIDSILRKMK